MRAASPTRWVQWQWVRTEVRPRLGAGGEEILTGIEASVPTSEDRMTK